MDSGCRKTDTMSAKADIQPQARSEGFQSIAVWLAAL